MLYSEQINDDSFYLIGFLLFLQTLEYILEANAMNTNNICKKRERKYILLQLNKNI